MNEDAEKQESQLPEIPKIKVYKTRWLILGIFVLFSASNALQWIQYSIITSTITKYYNISTTWVDWTSMIYMVLYIPFIFPGSYILEKLGLRNSIIIGVVGNCVGSWIKVASVDPSRFWVGFIGQSIVALSQVFVLSVPARLAAVWFGPSQVSSACSIGVFGNQLGIAVGFVLPTMMVNTDIDTPQDVITNDLFRMFLWVAIFITVLLLLVLIFFKDAPPTPPSYAQAQQDEPVDFVKSLKNLCLNKSYIFLMLAYGINVGIFYAISTLLQQIVLEYYPGGEKDAGRIGLVIVLAGMVGSVCCGVVLDRFHRFKETTLAVYAFSLIGMVLYTFTLSEGIIIVYIVSGVLGFFMTGLLPVGFELAAELTYPEPEGTSSGLLNAASQVFGVAFTSIYSELLYKVGDTWANATMCIMLLVGTILTALISKDMRRQAAQSAK
ncbi:uncharacterized MFS-type transporter C09D4.1 [Aethina tumida]|uniref:uncharacterized MFS-type transporter C09D4.1 n=1 Tax=Aethina tumida TaxID=116153 RepID=UPI002147D17C|nr:uncharacterized MFS-type transporter C09D4.1 [Aethina tumida]